MRFLTNLYDPTAFNAEQMIATEVGQTREEALKSQNSWLNDKIIGDPKATDDYTVAELQQQNMVGVYAKN